MTFRAFQGHLRPLVEAAWKNHAGLYGVSATDQAERDAFYRTHLWVTCRVKSTKDADERQRVAILTHFRDLAPAAATVAPRADVEPPGEIQVIGLSRSQEAAFVKLARRAWQVARSRKVSGSDAPFAEWVASRLQESFKHPIRDYSGALDFGADANTRGFDTAMGTLAVIANDTYWIGRTADGTERRLRWQLDRFLEDLSWLEGVSVGWSYVCGIHKAAHHALPADVADATVPQLAEVLEMLDTHIRRICRRLDIPPCYCPTRPPTGLTAESQSLLAGWERLHLPTPGHTRGPDGRLLQQKGVA